MLSLCCEHVSTLGLCVLLVLLGVSIWWARTVIRRHANLPPGPRPWPVIGNLPELRSDPIEAVRKLRLQYGDVFRLYMGSSLAIFVNGFTALEEVLVSRGAEFTDRPKLFIIDEISKSRGVASTSGKMWKEQRRFTLHSLRNFGFGKSSLENNVVSEAEALLSGLKSESERTFSIRDLLNAAVSNVISSLTFGRRFHHNDPKFQEYLKIVKDTLESTGTSPLTFLNWLKYIPGDPFRYKNLINQASKIDDFVSEEIARHKETYDPNNHRDFIDAYLEEIDRMQATEPNSTFKESTLVTVVGELFAAGSETTATTLLWALVFLINNPDVQSRLREEIHTVVVGDRLPSLSDKSKMPYTEAIILEVLRCGDIGPFGMPHAPSEDTTLGGYHIPKGTLIMPVITSVHKDPNIWENPEVFDPTRFLDSDRNIKKSQHFMPFSAGKRVCIGESLAKMEIFIFLTSMIQKFKFLPPEGVTSVPEDAVLGLARAPKPFELRVVSVKQ